MTVSVIMDSAMGQTPRSIELISSYYNKSRSPILGE